MGEKLTDYELDEKLWGELGIANVTVAGKGSGVSEPYTFTGE
jgi:hypothetical protein